MELPMRAFWSMLENIARIEAEQDRRALRVAGAAQSAEAAQELFKSLTVELGEVVSQDPVASAVFDKDGWEDLKRMAAQGA